MVFLLSFYDGRSSDLTGSVHDPSRSTFTAPHVPRAVSAVNAHEEFPSTGRRTASIARDRVSRRGGDRTSRRTPADSTRSCHSERRADVEVPDA